MGDSERLEVDAWVRLMGNAKPRLNMTLPKNVEMTLSISNTKSF